MPLAAQALAPRLWLLASESDDGSLPTDPADLAFRLRCSEDVVIPAVNALIAGRFLAGAMDFDSATLALCVQRAASETEVETDRETEAEKRPTLALAIAPAPRKGGWVGEACDDWNERYGPGSANGGRIGQALLRIVKAVAKSLHEPEPEAWSGTVRPAWRRYLAETSHPSPNAQDFASHFADWTTPNGNTGMVPSMGRAVPVSVRAQRGLDGINALIEGGLKGDGTL